MSILSIVVNSKNAFLITIEIVISIEYTHSLVVNGIAFIIQPDAGLEIVYVEGCIKDLFHSQPVN